MNLNLKTNCTIKLILCCIISTSISTVKAQITIGSSSSPNQGVILDIKNKSTNNGKANASGGLLLPRVYITTLKPATGKLSESIGNTGNWDEEKHLGLMVYNAKGRDACINEGADAGVYVWRGNEWSPLWAKTPLVHNPAFNTTTDNYRGANSYIAKTGNQILAIPIERAFKIWTDYAGIDKANGKVLDLADVNNLTGTLGTNIVWQEAIDGTNTGVLTSTLLSGYLSTATLYVVSGAKSGNALINVTLDNKVLWQWHIWVTNEEPNEKRMYYNNGKKAYWFMDRYLGANSTNQVAYNPSNKSTSSAYGLYYQWGRPTPIKKFDPIDVTPLSTITTEKENLTTAIQSPEFISYTTINSHDWYSSTPSQWNGRWGAKSTSGGDNIKSPFDPCPLGWRVPNGMNDLSPWECLSIPNGQTFNNGFIFNEYNREIGYYPASGYRSNGNGSLGDLGQSAYVWTGTPDDIMAYMMGFDNTNIFPWFEYNRANALNVRCILDGR